MKVFILWLHIMTPGGLGYDSIERIPHPATFTSQEACEKAGDEWIREFKNEVGTPNRYAVVAHCEERTLVQGMPEVVL